MGWRTRWTTTRRAVMFQSAASRDVSKLLKQGHSATSRGNSVEGFGNAGQSQEGVEADRPVSQFSKSFRSFGEHGSAFFHHQICVWYHSPQPSLRKPYRALA